jgi:hypothetical protein
MYSENQSNYLQRVLKLPKISVHLVCLGNICRSPIANAVLVNKFALLEKPKVPVPELSTVTLGFSRSANLLTSTALAIGERQILPRQTRCTLILGNLSTLCR